MNRTIKFRGKRKDNGEWLIGGYYFECWGCSYIAWGIDNDCASIIEVLTETVGQYTGLKDKNGVEIYEGDIVKYNYGQGTGYIYWDDYDSNFIITKDPTVGILHLGKARGIEVIGNIHTSTQKNERICVMCGKLTDDFITSLAYLTSICSDCNHLIERRNLEFRKLFDPKSVDDKHE